MAKPFDGLRERLLQAGVAPRHVRRYLGELADHLADLRAEELRAGRGPAQAQSAALARLGSTDDLARAMIEQPQFRAWCVRAPWATFALAPISALAAAYLVACSILWSGWRIFLPASNTPFIRMDAPTYASYPAWVPLAYFAAGRFLYFSAPILVGWGIAAVATRQRYKIAWPALGMILTAVMGATAQVHASRSAVPGPGGHVSLTFTPRPSAQDWYQTLMHGLVILTISILPYLVGRFQKSYSRVA